MARPHMGCFTPLPNTETLMWGAIAQCAECPGLQAFHCEGRRWVFSADEQNKIEFRYAAASRSVGRAFQKGACP